MSNFESVVGVGRSHYKKRPFVRFRSNKGGSCSGYLSKSTGLRGGRIDIQIDIKNSQIRIMPADGGVSVGALGTFTCAKNILDTCGSVAIFLTPGGDGWLYGELNEHQ